MNSSPITTVGPVGAQRVAPVWFGLRPGEWATLLVVSAAVVAASHWGWWPIAVTEAWGFVTGEHLEPPVRGWFAKRVCVVGAESTGTTTLARNLAEHLNTAWVEEFGREYSELKVAKNDCDWRSEEFVEIAREQSRREEAAARRANRVLICDTNAFATVLWHRRYLGTHSPQVEAVARDGRCDLYLLTGDEIPFVQDGLRDGEHVRHEMHRWFQAALAAQPVPWKLMRGSPAERLERAVALTQSLFNGSAWSPTAGFPTPAPRQAAST